MSIFVILNFVFAHLSFSITFKDFMSTFSPDWIRFLSHSMYSTKLSSSENISCQSLSFTNPRKPQDLVQFFVHFFIFWEEKPPHMFKNVLWLEMPYFSTRNVKHPKEKYAFPYCFHVLLSYTIFFIKIIRFHCNWCD